MLASLSAFRGQGSSRAWALTLFYFMAFGGFVAMFLYLPKLLVDVHDLAKTDAGARAAGFALLAVVARPVGGWTVRPDSAPGRVLTASFIGTAALAIVLAAFYEHMVPLTIACLTMAVFLGLGTGAVFKLVPEWFPQQVGAVTGVVGAAGGLGGFFPPLVMALVKAATGSYWLGFVLMAAVAGAALLVLRTTGRTAGKAKPRGRLRRWRRPHERRSRAPARSSVLRAARPLRRRLERGLDLRRATGSAPTATAGSTTRSCARPTASTAPARARGRSTSRTGSSPGRPRQTDYPSNGPDMPDYEPRGCPRGASFSWYIYSPLRLKYPYVRGACSRCTARRGARLGDPVEAWAAIVEDPETARAYKSQRGKGGFVRATWDEVAELIAAAHVHTIQPLRARPRRRLLADPGDVDGLVRGRARASCR